MLTNDNLEIAEGESLPLNLKLLRRRQRRSRRSIAVPIPVGQSVHRNDDYLCLDPNSERVEPLYTPESYQQYGVETPSTSADQTSGRNKTDPVPQKPVPPSLQRP